MIDVERLLTDLHIDYRNAGPDNVKVICLNPDHNDTAPSMSIHRELGIANCFGCGYSSSIFSILSFKGITGADAYKWLLKYAKNGQSEENIERALEDFIAGRNKSNKTDVIKYGAIELPQHRIIDSNIYLEKRGITKQDILEWKMSVVTEGASIGWILIPIYQDFTLRNYFLRSTFGIGKKYGKYPRHDLLPGIDLAPNVNKSIYVTEGIFDAIAVRHAGCQAVACLSNKLLPAQIDILKKYNRVVIVPDNDKMGTNLVRSASSLIYSTDLYVCTLPTNKKDAADCSPTEISRAITQEKKWIDYITKQIFF